MVFASGVASDFNPRPREEGDFGSLPIRVKYRYFNPRPREEGDALGSMCSSYMSDFNPRPREEGDLQLRERVSA